MNVIYLDTLISEEIDLSDSIPTYNGPIIKYKKVYPSYFNDLKNKDFTFIAFFESLERGIYNNIYLTYQHNGLIQTQTIIYFVDTVDRKLKSLYTTNNITKNNILHVIIDTIIDDANRNNYYIADVLISIFKNYKEYIDLKTYKLINNIFTKVFNYDLLKILEYLLTLDGLPTLIFEMIEERPFLALPVTRITMTDNEYNKYNLIYLQKLLDFIENTKNTIINDIRLNELVDENTVDNTISFKDESISIPNKIDILVINKNNIKERIQYFIAQILMNQPNYDLDEVLKKLLLADDVKDAKLLRTRLFQQYYLKESLSESHSSNFEFNLDIDTIIYFIKNNK